MLPKSFYRILQSHLVEKMSFPKQPRNHFASVDFVNPLAGGKTERVAVTYNSVPIPNMDIVFDQAQADYVLTLSDASWESFAGVDIAEKQSSKESMAKGHGTYAFSYAPPVGGRFVMRHDLEPMPEAEKQWEKTEAVEMTNESNPEFFPRQAGGHWFSYIDVTMLDPTQLEVTPGMCHANLGTAPEKAIGLYLETGRQSVVALPVPAAPVIPSTDGAAAAEEDFVAAVSKFPATVEVDLVDVGHMGKTTVRVWKDATFRKRFLALCYGEKYMTPDHVWNKAKGAWVKNPAAVPLAHEKKKPAHAEVVEKKQKVTASSAAGTAADAKKKATKEVFLTRVVMKADDKAPEVQLTYEKRRAERKSLASSTSASDAEKKKITKILSTFAVTGP